VAIQESGENYLETILMLKQTAEHVQSIDIARFMGYSKPSVSRAVKKLRQQGYIIMGDHGYIELTVKGYQVAKKIYERHTFFKDFLLYLGVNETIAKEDACRIEHVLSDQSFQAIKDFVIRKKQENCN
jgi:Mn-dependent DtxR family transcriptional regulator